MSTGLRGANGAFRGRGFAYGEYGGRNEPVGNEDGIPVCRPPFSPDFSPKMKLGGFGKMRYIRTRDWKMVSYVDDMSELCDRRNDPHELNNLDGNPAIGDVRRELTDSRLEQMMRVSNPGVETDSVS